MGRAEPSNKLLLGSKRIRTMTISKKLISTYMAVGILSVASMGAIAWLVASGGLHMVGEQGAIALEANAYDQLKAMREMKMKQVNQYFANRKNDLGVLVETIGTFRDEAFAKLTAVREVKRAAVERYFQSIRNQILTFSEDKMVVDAASEFPAAFRQVVNQAGLTDTDIQRMRAELLTYYTDQFAPKYMEENSGKSPDAQRYFDQLDKDSIVLQYHYIQANPNPLGSKHLLDSAEDGSSYSKLHGQVHPVIRSYLEKFGYYDIFIADSKTGDIVYSVFKELDYSTSLIDGPYAQTNFGEAFRRANEKDNKDAVVLVDYERYAPSYEAPAGFIASPVFKDGKKVAIALFQMPIQRLNNIMNERAGLGETGETYLVGSDLLMRSDSYLDPVNHTVVASFAVPETGKVDTKASRESLAGKTETEVVIDYNGNPVLSAYCPVDIGGIKWGLLAEIDVAEAFSPKNKQGQYFLEKYNNACGYYDLFLINPDGYCFYTVCHEDDYQTNLLSGKYADSNLGKAVRTCLDTRQFAFGDFAPYAPSAGAPAAFIAQPVLHQDSVQMVVALQLSDATINEMMAAGSSKDRTLEAYLVGADGHMRSDSILNPHDYSIKASFGKGNRVDTEAVREAINGRAEAKVITDYLGNKVLSAWAPLDVFGTKWALLCEIDEVVAMAAKAKMANTGTSANNRIIAWIAGGIIVVGLLVAFLAWVMSRQITNPLKTVVSMLKDIAEGEGDLTRRLEVRSQDELGDLARWFDVFVKRIHDLICRISNTTVGLAGSSTELAAISTYMAVGVEDINENSASVSTAAEEMTTNMNTMSSSSEEMATNVKSVAAAIEEMTASISEIANNAEQAACVAEQARTLAEVSNGKMERLGDAADEIGKVIDVIQDIAEQTNLLALNATIEAARAGDAGKGFAVVATEVKELAKQTAEATEGISKRVAAIQENTGESVSAIAEIREVINRINGVARTIASAVEEQSVTTKEISQSVAQAAAATETVTRSVTESAEASQEMTQNVFGIGSAAQQASKGAVNTQEASNELSNVAQELKTMVEQFKVSDNRFYAAPVKAAHALWRKRLVELLAGKISLDPAEIGNHQNCAFGKWYSGDGVRKFGDMPVFREIDSHHETVHRMARNIVCSYNEGQKMEARAQFDELHDVVVLFFSVLDKLEEQADRLVTVDV